MLTILGVIFGGLICKLTAWVLKASLELWKAIWHFFMAMRIFGVSQKKHVL